jgi:Zn-dependent M16 (insulinase) family peptidase
MLPSKVAYAVMGGKSDRVAKNLGAMRVARSILSYEYLWNTVRVQSGAYGTGFVPRRDGTLSFYSYRDPAPARSLGFYRSSAEYLRSLVNSGEDITKFIIGAIGEYDTLITPRTATTIATADYLNGWSAEDDAKVRQDMLNMTCEDLLTVADIIDEVLSSESTIIVGGQEHLDTLTDKPESIMII